MTMYCDIDAVKRIAAIPLTVTTWDSSLTISVQYAGRFCEAYIAPYMSTLSSETFTLGDEWVFNALPLSTWDPHFEDAVALIAAEDHYRRYQAKTKPDRNYEAEGIRCLEALVKIYWVTGKIVVSYGSDNSWE